MKKRGGTYNFKSSIERDVNGLSKKPNPPLGYYNPNFEVTQGKRFKEFDIAKKVGRSE